MKLEDGRVAGSCVASPRAGRKAQWAEGWLMLPLQLGSLSGGKDLGSEATEEAQKQGRFL